jgi:CHAT domain-containing protein
MIYRYRYLLLMVLTLVMILSAAQATTEPTGDSNEAARVVSDQAISETMGLVREMAASSEPFAWLEANQTRLTPEVGDAADQIALQLLTSGHSDRAIIVLALAHATHTRLDHPVRALNSKLLIGQAYFILAETVEDYQRVRQATGNIRQNAEVLGAGEIAFQSRVLGADASYFQGQLTEGNQQQGESLQQTLGEITDAWLDVGAARGPVWIERLVSLTAATVEEATRQYFVEQDKIEAALKRLMPMVESAIPVDFAYQAAAVGDMDKSIETARTLARLSYLHGNASIASARLAVATRRAVTAGDPGRVASVIHERYQGERRAGASAPQLRRLRNEAWAQAQDLRAGYRSRGGRIWAAYKTDQLYGTMIKDELADAQAPMDRLFEQVEGMKARMLLDSLVTPQAKEIATDTARQLERMALSFESPSQDDSSLTLEEMQLLSQLSDFQSLGGGGDSRWLAISDLEKLYRDANAGYGEPATPVSLKSIQLLLAPDEALLEYLIPYDALHPAGEVWLLLITHDGLRRTRVDLNKVLPVASAFTGRMAIDGRAPVDSSALGDVIVTLRTAIRSADETQARRLLRGLYQLLIEPLCAFGFRLGDYRRLMIVPHGALHYVPFAALLDGDGHFLIEHAQIVMLPSASVWATLKARGNGASTRFVAFANPDLHSRGIADLPFADQEVVAISDILETRELVLRRGDATKGRLIAEAGGAGLLHLSTHGEFPDQNASDEHAVWLADDKGRAVALNAAEVRELPLDDNRLVVLSVCNGGLYRIGPADEPYGLMPSFLKAGSRNVVATLWPLDDQFGRDFMIEFYRHLDQGIAEALRSASRRFIEEDEYLRHWAAFVVVGSGDLERPLTGWTRSGE